MAVNFKNLLFLSLLPYLILIAEGKQGELTFIGGSDEDFNDDSDTKILEDHLMSQAHDQDEDDYEEHYADFRHHELHGRFPDHPDEYDVHHSRIQPSQEKFQVLFEKRSTTQRPTQTIATVQPTIKFSDDDNEELRLVSHQSNDQEMTFVFSQTKKQMDSPPLVHVGPAPSIASVYRPPPTLETSPEDHLHHHRHHDSSPNSSKTVSKPKAKQAQNDIPDSKDFVSTHIRVVRSADGEAASRVEGDGYCRGELESCRHHSHCCSPLICDWWTMTCK